MRYEVCHYECQRISSFYETNLTSRGHWGRVEGMAAVLLAEVAEVIGDVLVEVVMVVSCKIKIHHHNLIISMNIIIIIIIIIVVSVAIVVVTRNG